MLTNLRQMLGCVWISSTVWPSSALSHWSKSQMNKLDPASSLPGFHRHSDLTESKYTTLAKKVKGPNKCHNRDNYKNASINAKKINAAAGCENQLCHGLSEHSILIG